VRELVAAGHDVTWYTGRAFVPLVEKAGARAVLMPPELDYEASDPESLRDGKQRTMLAQLKWDILNVFVKPIPAHVAAIHEVIDEIHPDVVVADSAFMAGPLAAEMRGLPRVVFPVSPLGLSSVDTAPFGMGLAPSSSALGRLRNRSLNWVVRSIVFGECQREAEQIRASFGLPVLTDYFMDWGVRIADRYLVPSIPDIEYPRSDLPESIEFIGAMLPTGSDDFVPPVWWDELAAAKSAGRPVVLVTQGTVATDPANLVQPAIAALASRDALVIATTADRNPDDVSPPDTRPGNLRIERFVPFTELLPYVDVMVTNGGYGGVQMALAHGVPLVVAGRSEDKMEVNARVAWAGVGVSLKTESPAADDVGAALATVLGNPAFRVRAQELQAVYARYGGAQRAAEVVVEVAAASGVRA
jgi:MGT family glycosyltransferase